jgi:hypothetical protein
LASFGDNFNSTFERNVTNRLWKTSRSHDAYSAELRHEGYRQLFGVNDAIQVFNVTLHSRDLTLCAWLLLWHNTLECHGFRYKRPTARQKSEMNGSDTKSWWWGRSSNKISRFEHCPDSLQIAISWHCILSPSGLTT